MKGFLDTGAIFGADLNLVVQLSRGVALVAGAGLLMVQVRKQNGFRCLSC